MGDRGPTPLDQLIAYEKIGKIKVRICRIWRPKFSGMTDKYGGLHCVLVDEKVNQADKIQKENSTSVASRGGSIKGPGWSRDHPKLGKMAVRIFKDHPSLGSDGEEQQPWWLLHAVRFRKRKKKAKFFFKMTWPKRRRFKPSR